MKKHLLNFWLLLLCMIAGAGTAWADETLTIGFEEETYTDWTLTTIATKKTNSNVPAHGGSYFGNTDGKATGSVVTKEKIASPKSITFYVSKQSTNNTASSWLIKVSSDGTNWEQVGDAQSASSGITRGTWTEVSRDLSSYSDVYVGVFYDGTTAIRCIDDVTITYSTGGSELANNNLALKNTPIALNFDLYDNATAQIINYTTSSTGAVTIDESDYATFEIDEDDKTITVTPKAVTPETQTITVNQAAYGTYKAGSATFTVTISDSTPIPTHTATFSVNGNTTTQDFEEGANIVFPSNPADVNGKKFMGWVTEAIEGTTNEEPSFVTSATMSTNDVTYYAVFATVTPGTAQDASVTINTSTANLPTSYGGGNKFTEYTLDGVKFKIQQMYKNGSKLQWRADGNSNGAGTMYNTEALQNIQSVVITYDASDSGKNFTLKVGDSENPTTGTSITPTNSDNVYTFDCSSYNKNYFVLANGEYAGYLTSIVINYQTGNPDTYSEYCTNVIAAAVEKPVITVAENPFLFSTTATITCETEGAAIKYSYDGENWNDYTDALTITATTTIYAKAVKGNDESSVAQYTATKNLAEPIVAINANGITNTNVFIGTAAGSLSATVTYNEAAVEGAAVTWSGNNDEVATINASTGVVTLVSAGSVTFTATYAGNSDYSEKAATYEMTVSNFDPNAPGTENNPYTVADAIAFINTLGSATSSTEVYVSGIISQIDSYNSKYGSIQYWISDDGTTTGQMEVYSGLGLNGAEFSAVTDLQLGDVVTVKGYVKMYNTTPEFDKNNQLVSLVRKPTPELAWSVDSYTATYGESNTYPTLTNPNSVTVAYSSSDTNIATVDPSTGEITLKANGETDITATFAGDETYKAQEVSYTLTVTGLKESAEISFSEVEINMPYDEDYTGQVLTNPNSVAVTYESSDSEVAEVDENTGELLLYKAGTVTITANFAGNETYAAGSASYTLNVTKADAGLAFVEVGPFYVAPNAAFEVPSLTNPHSLTVVWSSTAEDVAVADGSEAVIGSKLGTAVITASFAGDDRYNEGSASYTIIVSNDVVVTWDLSTDQTDTATISEMTWTNTNATMAAEKGSASTATNNYYPGKGDYSSTRFYKNSTLTINPLNGFAIKSVVFTATTNSYASALVNSEWTNAYAAASETTVTVIPTDGTAAVSATIGATTGHSSVVVTLTKSFGAKLNSEGYATFAANAPLDFTDDSEFSAWQITGVSGSTITFSKITGSVAAGTGVLLMGTASESISIPVAASGTDISSTNKLTGITTATTIAADEYYGLKGNTFVKVNAGTIPAGKALLPASEITSTARELTFVFEGDGTTGIKTIDNGQLTNDNYYDLQGRKVNNPKAGLYIKNGNKVVIK